MLILSLLRSKLVVLIMMLASVFCLYPGLTMPMLSIEISASFPVIGEIELYKQTQSIWSSIVELAKKEYFLVAFLIFLFSIAVPFVKLMCIVAILLFESSAYAERLHKFVLFIGKWSMADVFVVAIFIAFMASEAKSDIQAELHSGFYWFLGYCLISIACGQLLNFKEKSYNVK